MVLREFLYLDGEVVDQFLAQLEGGAYSEEAERVLESGGRQLGGELGIGGPGGRVGAKAGKTSASEREVERTVRRTPESLFSQLYDRLAAEGDLQPLESFDSVIWDQLRRGEIMELEAAIAVSTLAKWANLANQFGPIAEAMKAGGQALDEETMSVMQMFSMFGGILGDAIPITARPVGAPEFAFPAILNPASLRSPVDHLDGEATVLAKLQRKLRDDERYTTFDAIPGIRGLPEQARAEMSAQLSNSPEFPDMVIEPPVATISVVAIYR